MLFTRFSITGIRQKNHERQYGLIHIVLSQHFHQSSKDIIIWPILSSQGFFINFRQKLVFYFCFEFQASFEKFESGTIRVDTYCPFRKILSTFIKNTYGLLLYFSIISSKFWPRTNTVWPISLTHIKDLI